MDNDGLLERLFDQVTQMRADMSDIKSDVRSISERVDRFGSDFVGLDKRVEKLETQRSHVAANITSAISLMLAIGGPIALYIITGGSLLCGTLGNLTPLLGVGLSG